MKRLVLSIMALLALVIPCIPTAHAGPLMRLLGGRSCGGAVSCSQPYYSYTPAYVAPYVAPVVTPTYTTPVQQQVIVNTAPAYTPNWRSDLLAYQAKRDDLQAYLDALNAIGFQGQSYNIRSLSQSYGGNTQYGYSYQNVAQAYGTLDMSTLFQQSARLTSQAQQLSGDANSQFSALVGQAGTNQARIAEILARAAAAEKVLNATAPAASTTTITTGQGTQVGPAPIQPRDGDQVAIEEQKAFLQKVAIPACASCHSGNNVQGGFNLADYSNMTLDAKQKVWDRINSADPAKRMPKVADGAGAYKPGTALTPEQKRAFFTH